MPIETLFIDTCDVRRYSEGAQGDYGFPAKTWADLSTDQACRLMATTRQEVIFGAELVIADYKLFTGMIDITEQDRVVIDEITYEVVSVATKKDGAGTHHKESYLRVLR